MLSSPVRHANQHFQGSMDLLGGHHTPSHVCDITATKPQNSPYIVRVIYPRLADILTTAGHDRSPPCGAPQEVLPGCLAAWLPYRFLSHSRFSELTPASRMYGLVAIAPSNSGIFDQGDTYAMMKLYNTVCAKPRLHSIPLRYVTAQDYLPLLEISSCHHAGASLQRAGNWSKPRRRSSGYSAVTCSMRLRGSRSSFGLPILFFSLALASLSMTRCLDWSSLSHTRLESK
ncbi:hypothetical protein F4780DRAFT_671452 [Xylariomycetidae sp. FL0641]|nr:hypothetical protein F4780DRAFT_671452 [Xylariomycetidae sp. FL0641]